MPWTGYKPVQALPSDFKSKWTACDVPVVHTIFPTSANSYVPLDKESQQLTTFITDWGRFMYLRMPQGYLASGDDYTRRYNVVIKMFPTK